MKFVNFDLLHAKVCLKTARNSILSMRTLKFAATAIIYNF